MMEVDLEITKKKKTNKKPESPKLGELNSSATQFTGFQGLFIWKVLQQCYIHWSILSVHVFEPVFMKQECK